MRNSKAFHLLISIPLILDEITASFSSQDLSNCTQVCSSWNAAFAPILWKDIHLNNHQVVSMFRTSPAVLRGIERNAEHVRTIRSVFCYPFHSFVTMKLFDNLTRVDSLASELHNKGIVDHTNTRMLLIFIKLNSSIREITLTNFPLSSVPTSALLENLIANHTGLESVAINCFRDTQLASVQHVLRGAAMSKNVARLSLVCRSSGALVSDSAPILSDISGSSTSQLLPEGHVASALREITLDLTLHISLSVTLTHLVRHCPSLQRLYIPNSMLDKSFEELCSTLHQHCPKLLHLEGGINNPQDSQLAMLLNSSRSLKSYTMKGSQTLGPLSVQVLLNNRHCFALERLSFKQCIGIESKHIQLVLTSCPNLKSFQALSTLDRHDIFDPRLHIRDLPIASIIGSRWACRGLQELQIGFTGFSEIPEGQPVQPYVDYIYDQLAELTELRELHLGGELGTMVLPENSPAWMFDLTLRSGIHKLSKLKQLKILNIQRLRHHRIGIPEVRWMIFHWPHIAEFHGPFIPSIQGNADIQSKDNRDSRSGKPIPFYLQEMTRHRPKLVVSIGMQHWAPYNDCTII